MTEPRKMVVSVPTVDLAMYPVTRITVECPGGKTQYMECLSNTLPKCEFMLPHYIRPKTCGIYVEMCSASGTLDPSAARIVIQEMPQRYRRPTHSVA